MSIRPASTSHELALMRYRQCGRSSRYRHEGHVCRCLSQLMALPQISFRTITEALKIKYLCDIAASSSITVIDSMILFAGRQI